MKPMILPEDMMDQMMGDVDEMYGFRVRFGIYCRGNKCLYLTLELLNAVTV